MNKIYGREYMFFKYQLLLMAMFFAISCIFSQDIVLQNNPAILAFAYHQGDNSQAKGEFKEATDHQYGFDDYTNWTPNNKYYSNVRKGICEYPYLSIEAGTNGQRKTGYVLFNNNIIFERNKKVSFISNTNYLSLAPNNTNNNSKLISISTNGTPNSSIEARYSNSILNP